MPGFRFHGRRFDREAPLRLTTTQQESGGIPRTKREVRGCGHGYGHFDQYIIDHLQGLDALLLESNHDVRMLETGPYPYYLKRRILGDHGHLSNENAGRLFKLRPSRQTEKNSLGHLSKENNYEELANETGTAGD